MRSECEDSADTGHSTDAAADDTAGESTDQEEESVYNGNMDSPSSQEGSGIETPTEDKLTKQDGGPPGLIRIDELMYDLDGLSVDVSNRPKDPHL